MTEAEPLSGAVHILLIPRQLRLASDEKSDGIDPRNVTTEDLMDAGHGLVFFWDSLTLHEVTPDSTRRCLWDLIDLVSVPEESLAEECVRFVERWGTLDFGEDAPYMVDLDQPQHGDPLEFLWLAQRSRSLLVTLAATEVGELVDERLLLDLKDGDAAELEAPSLIETLISGSLEDYMALKLERQRARWRDQRAAGQGLDLQRSLVSTLVTQDYLFNPEQFEAEWSSNGRRVQRVSRGVREIIGAHVSAVFMSPQVDIFTCSVCGKPFEFVEYLGKRRPRRGTQRFCSKPCRSVARRASNRKAWHQNKAKWRHPRERGEKL